MNKKMHNAKKSAQNLYTNVIMSVFVVWFCNATFFSLNIFPLNALVLLLLAVMLPS